MSEQFQLSVRSQIDDATLFFTPSPMPGLVLVEIRQCRNVRSVLVPVASLLLAAESIHEIITGEPARGGNPPAGN